ncbi:7070_t:CDS:2, partial [Ambispora leptoticha]
WAPGDGGVDRRDRKNFNNFSAPQEKIISSGTKHTARNIKIQNDIKIVIAKELDNPVLSSLSAGLQETEKLDITCIREKIAYRGKILNTPYILDLD